MKDKSENLILGAAFTAAAFLIAKANGMFSSTGAVGAAIISKDRARHIANLWHGGQWSPLYQFASSGEYIPSQHLQYLKEVYSNIENEYYAPYPQLLTKKELSELKSLLKWFEYKGKENGIHTEYVKSKHYGYTKPVGHVVPGGIILSQPIYPE